MRKDLTLVRSFFIINIKDKKNMVDLSEYILEGIFDEISNTELTKQIVDGIKAWAKNIYKRGGRIKVDSKTGKITLPETWLEIQCPIPAAASFDIIKNTSIKLIDATDKDLLKFSNCRLDNTSKITIEGGTVSYLPKYMENVGEVGAFVNGDLDISEINNIGNLRISVRGNLTGCQHLKSVDTLSITGYDKKHIKDNFNNLTYSNKIRLCHVQNDAELFKNLKNLSSITFNKCSPVDISNIKHIQELKIEECEVFIPAYWPRNIDYVDLNNWDESFNITDLDLQNFPNISKMKYNGTKFNIDILKDKDALTALAALQYAAGKNSVSHAGRKSRGTAIPQEIIDYFIKNCKQVKYDNIDVGKEYFVMPVDWIRDTKYLKMYKISGRTILSELEKRFPFNTYRSYDVYGYSICHETWERGYASDTELRNTFTGEKPAYIFEINNKVEPLVDIIMDL